MNDDFLLSTDSARLLYHDYAKAAPILDYHCHINPADIATDKRYDTITDLWLGGDHYKWRAMRCNGIPESEITGARERDPFLLFQRWTQTLQRAIGNPLYHWSYLELKRYFGIDEALTEANCRAVYDRCNERLQDEDMSVRGLIRQSRVNLICTTDDPADDLQWHRSIAEDTSFACQVLPAFRPDKAMNVDKPGFAAYVETLAAAAGSPIRCFDDLMGALRSRMDFFDRMGCRVSDHALDHPVCTPADPATLDAIFAEALEGEVSTAKADALKTAVLTSLAARYAELGWAMQIHYGCIRNNSDRGLANVGCDSGFDCMADSGGAAALVNFLRQLENAGALPRMVLYSLNPADNEVIMTVAGSFSLDSGCATKIQLGSAWWFNDHKTGMQKQLIDFANLGVLGNFIGMLTDSRSFLSYTRHEYFRRILCDLVGRWMEDGEIVNDPSATGGLIRDISYNNAVRFFGFDLPLVQ